MVPDWQLLCLLFLLVSLPVWVQEKKGKVGKEEAAKVPEEPKFQAFKGKAYSLK